MFERNLKDIKAPDAQMSLAGDSFFFGLIDLIGLRCGRNAGDNAACQIHIGPVKRLSGEILLVPGFGLPGPA